MAEVTAFTIMLQSDLDSFIDFHEKVLIEESL
jgi:hypothetical protein